MGRERGSPPRPRERERRRRRSPVARRAVPSRFPPPQCLPAHVAARGPLVCCGRRPPRGDPALHILAPGTMTARFVLRGGDVVTPARVLSEAALVVEDGRILEILA